MPIPRYWAKEIWLAAITESSGKSPVDPEDDWEDYMSSSQLSNAYSLTTEGLKEHGYRASWKLMTVKNTNPIDGQIDLLAATTDKIADLDETHVALTRFAAKNLR